MRIHEPEGADEPTLNLTPLIDVVFLLLIFFLLATTFLEPEKEIGIDLPESEWAQAEQVEQDELVINVTREGTFILSGRELDYDQLAAALRQAARKNPGTPVTIRGDRLAHHEFIVKVMGACGAAGLVNLSVGTLEES